MGNPRCRSAFSSGEGLKKPAPDEGITMRAVLLLLILVIVALVIAIATGFLDINQIRGAQAPQVRATGNGVSAKGGQSPKFDVETGSVEVGSRNATVKVPAVRVKPPQEQANASQPAANSTAPL
jgi:hypothetical protein